MNPSTIEHTFEYAAFISYRHMPLDRKWAKWLHSALEQYRTPAALVDAKQLPRRLGRVFRDEEELAASADLSTSIERALVSSRYLIVVCSKNTAGSRWVNAEIDKFIALGRSEKILSLLIDGEPEESFPKSLFNIRHSSGVIEGTLDNRLSVSSDHLGGQSAEPLAADVRPLQGESMRSRRRHALYRLTAPMLGCTFDELRQREQERKMRFLLRLVTATMLMASAFAGLAIFAALQRSRAQSLATANGNLAAQEANARRQSQRDQVKTQRELIANYVARGSRILQDNDLLNSLPAFIEALRLEEALAADSSLSEVLKDDDARGDAILHRLRIGMLFAQAPALLGQVNSAEEILDYEISPDSKWLAIATNNGRLTLFNTSNLRDPVLTHSLTDELPEDTKLEKWEFISLGSRTKPQSSPRLRSTYVSTSAEIQSQEVEAQERDTQRPADDSSPMPDLRGRGRSFDLAAPIPRRDPYITNVAFTPTSNRLLIYGNNPDCVRVWDLDTNRLLSSLGKFASNSHLDCSPDGTRYCVCGYDHVKVFETDTAKALTDNLVHEDVEKAYFIDSGSRLVTVGKQLKVWDLNSSREISQLFASDKQIYLDFDAKRESALVTRGNQHQLFDCGSWEAIGPEFVARGGTRSLSPDGLYLACNGTHGLAQCWSTKTGTLLIPHMSHNADAEQLQFNMDGRAMLSRAGDKVRLWEATTYGSVITSGIAHAQSDAQLSSDGKLLAVAAKNFVQLWHPWSQLIPSQKTVLHRSNSPVSTILPANDGYLICPPMIAHKFQFIKRDGGVRDLLEIEKSGLGSAVVSRDGKFALVGSLLGDNIFQLYRLEDDSSAPTELKHEPDAKRNSLLASAFSPDSQRCAIASDAHVSVYNLSDMSTPQQKIEHSHTNLLAFNAQGTRIAACTGPDTWTTAKSFEVSHFDISNGQLLGKWSCPEGRARLMEFNRTGDQLVTVIGDSAYVWDVERGVLKLPALTHTGMCYYAGWSSDEKILVTVGKDIFGVPDIRLWDGHTGSPIGAPISLSGVQFVDNPVLGFMPKIVRASLTEDYVLAVEFVRDQEGGQLERWSWQLRPDDRQVAALSKLAAIQSGYLINDSGTSVPLSPAPYWEKEAQNIQTSLPANADYWQAFYESNADSAKSVANGYAERYYVGKLVDIHPQDPNLLFRQGKLLLEHGSWQDAIEHFNRSIDCGNPSYEVYASRGDAYAELQDWNAAFKDILVAYQKCNEQKPHHFESTLLQLKIDGGYALAAMGRAAEYKTVARSLLAQHLRSRDPGQIRSIVRLCLLVPETVENAENFALFCSNSVERFGATNEQITWEVLGLVRTGQVKKAIDVYQEQSTKYGGDESVFGGIAATMLLQAIRNTDEANKLLKQMVTWAEKNLKKPDIGWRRRVEIELLLNSCKANATAEQQ